MAASRVDLEIGGDPTTATNNKSPILRDSLASKTNSSEKITNDIGRERKVASKNDGMGRVVVAEDHRGTSGKQETQGRNSMVHECPERSRLPLVQDEASKSWRTAELADKTEQSFNVEIEDPKELIWQDKFSAERKRANVDLGTDNSTQINKHSGTKSRKKPENSEASISARVIYKLVGSSKQRGWRENAGKKDPRELSPQRRPRDHGDLIVDTTTGGGIEGLAASRAEAPRKLADSPIDRAIESAIKGREDVQRRVTRSFTSQESPRVSEPRFANDVTPVRQQARRNQSDRTKCPNCGEPHPSYEKSSPRKYSGLLECEVQLYNEENNAKESRNGRETKHETPVVASLLYRSRSLPRLSVHDSGVACSGNEQSPAAGHAHNSKQLLADLKQLHTLKQHYYPEGGWGWVVVFVGTLVQMLSHGVHGSSGIFLQQVADKFSHPVYSEPG